MNVGYVSSADRTAEALGGTTLAADHVTTRAEDGGHVTFQTHLAEMRVTDVGQLVLEAVDEFSL